MPFAEKARDKKLSIDDMRGGTFTISNLGGVGGEVQKTRLAGMPNAIYYEGIRSTSAYFDGGEKGKFILCAIDQPGEHGNNGLLGLKLNPGDADHAASFERLWTMSRPINGPSCPIVTSNGEANPITWVVECEGNGSSLLAFDVITGRELYNSQTSGAADHWEGGRRFTSPIASNGKLYIGAQGIYCFGLKGRKE